jgi:spore maturation protein CgeB
MRFVLFCHSLASDWNHGNAHFLRGVASELIDRGHELRAFEPRDAWSAQNLVLEAGPKAVDGYRASYPTLRSTRYDASSLDLEDALDGADVVLVHEWNSHDLVKRIGHMRRRGGRFALLFLDTHHRSVTKPDEMAAYSLEDYDGVLAFGEVIRERYVENGWSRRAWTWHEAADPRVFHPLEADKTGDLVWIGNWGDDERSAEIRQFLIEPARALRLSTCVHGVRYPEGARRELADAGVDYRGWLPNYRAPEVYAQFRLTVHIPRRPYVEALPGIPTIRVFEALACGIPLVSCWWDDSESLFTAGGDFLMVRTPGEMRSAMARLLQDADFASAIAQHGHRTVLERHTCAHRVDELLDIVATLLPRDGEEPTSPRAETGSVRTV